jgi:hypothetical protein
MDIARVDKKTGIVVNVEFCDPEWLLEDSQVNSKDFLFIENEKGKGFIGHIWDGESFKNYTVEGG